MDHNDHAQIPFPCRNCRLGIDHGLMGCGAEGDFGQLVCIAPAGHPPDETKWASLDALARAEGPISRGARSVFILGRSALA